MVEDAIDELNRRIAALAQSLGAEQPQDVTVNKTVNNTTTNRTTYNTSEPSEENQPRNWFSSGPSAILLSTTDTGWQRVDFGFIARAVQVRFDGPVELAPRDPNKVTPPTFLPAPSGDWGTYEIGGSPPIQTAFLWLRAHSSATSDVSVYVEAY